MRKEGEEERKERQEGKGGKEGRKGGKDGGEKGWKGREWVFGEAEPPQKPPKPALNQCLGVWGGAKNTQQKSPTLGQGGLTKPQGRKGRKGRREGGQ